MGGKVNLRRLMTQKLELKASRCWKFPMFHKYLPNVPQIFIQPPANTLSNTRKTHKSFPIIDLDGTRKDPIEHKEVVDKIWVAATENWGFFQIVNHGFPAEAVLICPRVSVACFFS